MVRCEVVKRAHAVILFFWAIFCPITGLECLRSKASARNPLRLKKIPVVDYLIHTLEYEKWFDEETCREATFRMLNGVKNDTLWATALWDSMQLSLGMFFGSEVSLGSYDQCLRSPWSSEINTQYCLVGVKIRRTQVAREYGPYDSAYKYLNTLSKAGKTSNHFEIGVCMPAVCSPSSIANFYRHVLRTTHLPEAEVVTLNPENCQGVEPEPYPKKVFVFWSVFVLLLGLVVVSTIYTLLNESKTNSNVDIVAKSFSVIRNWEQLLKVTSTEIRVLNGIRFLSMAVVVFIHQITFSLFKPSVIINNLDIDKITEGFFGQILGHIDLVVDSFFALSGLLLAKSLLSGRQNNLLLVLLKRYIRLMSLYAVMTLYILSAAQYTAAGPIWLKGHSIEGDVCEVHWWKNLLMISTDFKTMCFSVAWYVTCDYHLAILTVVLYWIYRKNQNLGILAFFAVGCGLTLKLTMKAFIQKAPLLLTNDIYALADIRSYKMINDVYVKWQDRVGSYLVGIAMGWLMTKYEPTVYRNAISKRTSFIIAAISLSTMLMVISIGYWLSEGRMEVAVAIATNRVVWAAAICGLIGACEYGCVPIISDFLGSLVFAPLSKLSYGIYMTHFFVIQRNVNVARSLLYFDMFILTINTLGTTVVSCVVSLILYMLVEAPCVNLSKYYLCEKKKEELITKSVKKPVPENHRFENGTYGATKFKGS